MQAPQVGFWLCQGSSSNSNSSRSPSRPACVCVPAPTLAGSRFLTTQQGTHLWIKITDIHSSLLVAIVCMLPDKVGAHTSCNTPSRNAPQRHNDVESFCDDFLRMLQSLGSAQDRSTAFTMGPGKQNVLQRVVGCKLTQDTPSSHVAAAVHWQSSTMLWYLNPTLGLRAFSHCVVRASLASIWAGVSPALTS